jgi:dolichol-phosphate mannosyltransferase
VKLSVVIPARDEIDSIEATLTEVTNALDRKSVDYEIVVVDDGSTDGTSEALQRAAAANPRIRPFRSPYAGGFGLAVRAGLEEFTGDAVAIMMADGSDDPSDLLIYHGLLEEGYDCAFGSRFVPGARVVDYPRLKLALNRIVNWGIRVLFHSRYNDTTNAFKAYRREVVEGIQPLLSNHFNLTVELPLKAIVRGYRYAVVPTSWRGRSGGRSKLDLQEMGSRYLFIVLYVFLEHNLSRGDYRRPHGARQSRPEKSARCQGRPAHPEGSSLSQAGRR